MLEGLELDNAKIVRLTGSNPFVVAKLLQIVSVADLGTASADLIGSFNLIPIAVPRMHVKGAWGRVIPMIRRNL